MNSKEIISENFVTKYQAMERFNMSYWAFSNFINKNNIKFTTFYSSKKYYSIFEIENILNDIKNKI
jgi:hypothetical protein